MMKDKANLSQPFIYHSLKVSVLDERFVDVSDHDVTTEQTLGSNQIIHLRLHLRNQIKHFTLRWNCWSIYLPGRACWAALTCCPDWRCPSPWTGPPAGTEARGVSSAWMVGGVAGQLQPDGLSGTGGHRRRRRMV